MKSYVIPVNRHGETAGDPIICETLDDVVTAQERLRWEGHYGCKTLREDLICDFCGVESAPVKWKYTVRAGGVIGSMGDDDIHIDTDGLWAACDVCHDYISEGNSAKLFIHSAESFLEKAKAAGRPIQTFFGMRALSNSVRDAHVAFWQAYVANGEQPPEAVESDSEFASSLDISWGEYHA